MEKILLKDLVEVHLKRGRSNYKGGQDMKEKGNVEIEKKRV